MATYIKLETEVTFENLLGTVQDGMSLNYHCMVCGSICTQHLTVPTDGATIQFFTKYLSYKLILLHYETL